MEFLQVAIITGKDGVTFQRNLNTGLKQLEKVVTLIIKGGPPGGYIAIITYTQKSQE